MSMFVRIEQIILSSRLGNDRIEMDNNRTADFKFLNHG